MEQNYSPIIGKTIPGFLAEQVVIPYQNNEFINLDTIVGLRLMIKNYGSSKILYETNLMSFDKQATQATFTVPKMMIGQYYNFQIAYILNEDMELSRYSDASVGKCIGSKVNCTILHDNLYETLKFNFSIDDSTNELIYTYQFLIYSQNGAVLEDSGTLFCTNGIIDTVEYHPLIEMEDGYSIQLNLVTINNYSIITKLENIQLKEKHEETNNFEYTIFKNYDQGCADISITNIISLYAPKNKKLEITVKRFCQQEGWIKLLTKEYEVNNIQKEQLNMSFQDFSVEHGVEYMYRVSTNANTVENHSLIGQYTTIKYQQYFSEMFLTDCDKQLKIQFNPQLSSFKKTILEQKTDTIGGKYPFIFRNNNVSYIEIPLSGLISYWMDDAETFVSLQQIGIDNKAKRSFDLTDYNIFAERQFKLEVLNWLNNGKPKLFRSPTEGNYGIRLTSVSLAPDEKLGRMLHTFSATGYQVCDSSHNDYIKKHIVPTPEEFLDKWGKEVL